MSYILDALKKSEQERKHGEIPGLNSLQNNLQPPRSTNRILSYLLIGTLLFNTMAISLWIFFRHKPTPSPVKLTIENTVKTTPALNDQAQRLVIIPAPTIETGKTSQQDQPAMPVVEQDKPLPSPVNIKTRAEIGSGAVEQSTIIVATNPASNVEGLNDTAESTSPDKPAPSQENIKTGAETGSGAVELSTVIVSENTDSNQEGLNDIQNNSNIESEEKRLDDSRESTAPPRPVLTTYATLPADIRSALPKLVIAAHYYSSNPSARMASINGRVMRQGQSVNNGLILEEIIREGVILSFQDYRFRLEVFTR